MSSSVKIDPEAIEGVIGQLQSVRLLAAGSKKATPSGGGSGFSRGRTASNLQQLMTLPSTSADELLVLTDNTINYLTRLKASVLQSDAQHRQILS